MFQRFNAGKPYSEQVKPANFVLLAHPVAMAVGATSPMAPYERDPAKWLELPWVDRVTGEPVRISTAPDDGMYRPGVIPIRTYRDVANEHALHPEMKSLAPDGGICQGHTSGLLRRRPVTPQPGVARVGKEGNEIDDRLSGVALHPEDYRVEYVDPGEWSDTFLPLLRSLGARAVAKATGLHRRTVERALSGRSHPHPRNQDALVALARSEAGTERAS
jgi:hypothetical protein